MHIRTLGVAGLGLLGRGIAACALAYGYRVVAYTRRQETHDSARAYIAQAIGELIERADFPADLADSWSNAYVATDAVEDLAASDFVIETIVEDIDAKRALFDRLEAAATATLPIASNTSSLPIALLQEGRRHPERFVGLHWSEHPHLTRFLEVIRGERTSDEVAAAAVALGEGMGKDPGIVKKDVPAFIVNRIAYAMYREALHLVETGVADAETIDRSVRNALGLWAAFCGPFRWIDTTGGPAMYGRAMNRVFPTLSNATEVPAFAQALIDEEAAGAPSGHGFFDYAEGEAEDWERRFRDHVWEIRRLQSPGAPEAR